MHNGITMLDAVVIQNMREHEFWYFCRVDLDLLRARTDCSEEGSRLACEIATEHGRGSCRKSLASFGQHTCRAGVAAIVHIMLGPVNPRPSPPVVAFDFDRLINYYQRTVDLQKKFELQDKEIDAVT